MLYLISTSDCESVSPALVQLKLTNRFIGEAKARQLWKRKLFCMWFIQIAQVSQMMIFLVGPVLTAQGHAARLEFAREHQNWQVHHWCPVLLTGHRC